MAGSLDPLDPLGQRKDALAAFLQTKVAEGFRIETQTDTHAIIAPGGRHSLLGWLRRRGAEGRFVVSVDEHAAVTMIPAEPIRS